VDDFPFVVEPNTNVRAAEKKPGNQQKEREDEDKDAFELFNDRLFVFFCCSCCCSCPSLDGRRQTRTGPLSIRHCRPSNLCADEASTRSTTSHHNTLACPGRLVNTPLLGPW
jgi:hypothetical protein